MGVLVKLYIVEIACDLKQRQRKVRNRLKIWFVHTTQLGLLGKHSHDFYIHLACIYAL